MSPPLCLECISTKGVAMNKMYKVLSIAGVFLLGFSATASATDGATLYKTKTCVACHGKDGKTPILPNYPKIAGQNAEYSEQQMLDIKTGARANGMSAGMKGIMHLVTDEEIKALAAYIETMEP